MDFIPVWGNGGKGENPLELVFSSANICYRVFPSHSREEANALILAGYPGRCQASSNETGHDVFIAHPGVPQETLASGLRALVLTAQPTAERPLRFQMVLEESRRACFPAFLNLPGWTEHSENRVGNYLTLECTFVWDPQKRTLLKGSFPQDPAEGDATHQAERREKLSAKVMAAITSGIADGSLQPPPDLWGTAEDAPSLAKSLASAGYHAGLASCSNPVPDWQIPLSDPLRLEDRILSEAHRKGWEAGRTRGLAITEQARKELSAKETAR